MLLGFNTNVLYNGKTYHVQTEDEGIDSPVINTLLYYQGEILCSKKTSYADLVGQPHLKEQLLQLMKEQHRKMIKELMKGKY